MLEKVSAYEPLVKSCTWADQQIRSKNAKNRLMTECSQVINLWIIGFAGYSKCLILLAACGKSKELNHYCHLQSDYWNSEWFLLLIKYVSGLWFDWSFSIVPFFLVRYGHSVLLVGLMCRQKISNGSIPRQFLKLGTHLLCIVWWKTLEILWFAWCLLLVCYSAETK